jgi:hypothetical protein
VKCFYNARNATPNTQDIEIINAFYDGVIDIKTVEEITMKKPKSVVDLLESPTDCIEASLIHERRGPQRRRIMSYPGSKK